MTAEEAILEQHRRCNTLIKQISPLLADQGELVQGAVLGNLLATWVMGHCIEGGSKKAIEKYRKAMLRMHIAWVRQQMERQI